MSFGDRLALVLDSLGITGNTFANRLERSSTQVHRVLTNKTRPRIDFVESIHKMYPQLNVDWLHTGRGEMWLSDQEGGIGVAEKPALSKPGKAAESQNPYHSASESYYREKYIAAQEKIARLYETIVELQKKGAAGNGAG